MVLNLLYNTTLIKINIIRLKVLNAAVQIITKFSFFSPGKLSLGNHELYNEDLELRLCHEIQSGGHEAVTNISAPSNFISDLPASLALFTGITRLDLSHNRLVCVPECLAALSGLTHLVLSNNLITEADMKTMTGLSSLRTLNLSGNQLEAIPTEILELTSLRSLYLGGNQIKEVGDKIS